MLPAGEIKDMTVPWLFQDLRAGKKSGTAVFEQNPIAKKVYFSNGDILFASSNQNDDRLGEFLLRRGKISQEQFDRSSAVVSQTSKKLGAVLLEAGILTPREIVDQVKLQVKQVILDLFKWSHGHYRFDEGTPTADEIIPLQMSTGNLILEGVQSLDWQVMRKTLPPLKKVLRPSTDPSLIFQNADLTQDQKNVLSLINGSNSIEKLCSLTELGDFNTLKTVYLLLALKMVETGELESGTGKIFAHEALCAENNKPPDKPDDSPEPVDIRNMIQSASEAMTTQDHFQVLGINKESQPQDVKRAYFKLAKLYHPDRHFEPQMADMKDKLEALFSRIHNAYQTLNDPKRRQQYLDELQKKSSGEYQETRPEDYVENYAEKTVRAVAYFNEGMKQFNTGNYWAAADAFAWTTRLDPLKAEYYFRYGVSLMHIPRRRREAEENLLKAIEKDPFKPEYCLELGNLYIKGGLASKALETYRAALQENPNSEQIMQAIQALESGTAGENPQKPSQPL